MKRWEAREIDWNSDTELARNLFSTTWGNHRITDQEYFHWHLTDHYKGNAIAFCAEPQDAGDMLAGLYLVVPTGIVSGDTTLDFSTSLYTVTHPSYYKTGIFKTLARLTYEKCAARGINGTIGVPNNNSLHGFSESLSFTVIGQFQMMVRIPFSLELSRPSFRAKKIVSEQELDGIEFSLDKRKADSGLVFGERTREFIKWRFFHCPGVTYHTFFALDSHNKLLGFIVLRKAKRLGIPITVIVDFLIDTALNDYEDIAKSLLYEADIFAWKMLAPIIFILVNPSVAETQVLFKNGFTTVPKKILPHKANFILKFHKEQPKEIVSKLSNFRNWYFSFADYDIY